MAVTTLDTHAVVKDLVAAGFTDAQAEAVTRQLQRAQDLDLSSLATKVDLAALAARTDLADLATKADLALLATKAELAALAAKTDLADLATRMDLVSTATKKDLLEARNEVLKWIVGSVALQVIAIIGTVVALWIQRLPPGISVYIINPWTSPSTPPSEPPR